MSNDLVRRKPFVLDGVRAKRNRLPIITPVTSMNDTRQTRKLRTRVDNKKSSPNLPHLLSGQLLNPQRCSSPKKTAGKPKKKVYACVTLPIVDRSKAKRKSKLKNDTEDDECDEEPRAESRKKEKQLDFSQHNLDSHSSKFQKTLLSGYSGQEDQYLKRYYKSLSVRQALFKPQSTSSRLETDFPDYTPEKDFVLDCIRVTYLKKPHFEKEVYDEYSALLDRNCKRYFRRPGVYRQMMRLPLQLPGAMERRNMTHQTMQLSTDEFRARSSLRTANMIAKAGKPGAKEMKCSGDQKKQKKSNKPVSNSFQGASDVTTQMSVITPDPVEA